MKYPKTGNEVFVGFSISDTMFSGLGKGTITREPVSADYLKDLFSKYGVIVSKRYRRGVLLPDLEGVDSAEQQVQIATMKAGLYNLEGLNMERFTVERFK